MGFLIFFPIFRPHSWGFTMSLDPPGAKRDGKLWARGTPVPSTQGENHSSTGRTEKLLVLPGFSFFLGLCFPCRGADRAHQGLSHPRCVRAPPLPPQLLHNPRPYSHLISLTTSRWELLVTIMPFTWRGEEKRGEEERNGVRLGRGGRQRPRGGRGCSP